MVDHICNNKFISEVKVPYCLVTWQSPVQHISQLLVMMLVQTNLPHANHMKVWGKYVYVTYYLATAINDGYNAFLILYFVLLFCKYYYLQNI